MQRVISTVLALALMGSCSKPRPAAPPPPPPAIVKPVPAKVGPLRPGDMVVRNCTVTKEPAGGHVDCICRRASTHLDANDSSKQSMVCR